MLHQLQVLQRFQAAFRGIGNGWGGMLGARVGMVGQRAMFPAWVRRDARRGMAKIKIRQPETRNSVFRLPYFVYNILFTRAHNTTLISGGGGGNSLAPAGLPTLTLLWATAADTHWKNLANDAASIVSSETTLSVSCFK